MVKIRHLSEVKKKPVFVIKNQSELEKQRQHILQQIDEMKLISKHEKQRMRASVNSISNGQQRNASNTHANSALSMSSCTPFVQQRFNEGDAYQLQNQEALMRRSLETLKVSVAER